RAFAHGDGATRAERDGARQGRRRGRGARGSGAQGRGPSTAGHRRRQGESGVLMGGADATETLVTAWCARAREAAFLSGDRAAIDATAAPRELVVDLVRARAPHADLFHSCAILGRLLAEHDGSPSLAASP